MTAIKLWKDESGFIVSIELILISTIAVIGLVAGMTAIRDAVVSEMSDVAGAVSDLNQSYTYNGTSSPTAVTAGSSYQDNTDSIDTAGDPVGAADNCIVFNVAPTDEGS